MIAVIIVAGSSIAASSITNVDAILMPAPSDESTECSRASFIFFASNAIAELAGWRIIWCTDQDKNQTYMDSSTSRHIRGKHQCQSKYRDLTKIKKICTYVGIEKISRQGLTINLENAMSAVLYVNVRNIINE